MTSNNYIPFILASASPRRIDLLKSIHMPPDKIIPSDILETVKPKELPKQYVMRMAQEKAEAIALNNANSRIFSADTIVVQGRRILGKPEGKDQAKQMLESLSGKRHRVYTAIFLIDPKHKPRNRIVQTIVKFKRLTEEDLKLYLQTNEWKDKAGAYAIQGMAGAFVKFISGSYSNVVGLPLFETYSLLSAK